MVELFREPFILKAVVCGILISVPLSGLGLFLVLRRLSLIGDGLAHVSFGGVSLGILLGKSPLYFTIPFCVLASIGILKVRKAVKISPDAAVGIISSFGIASGIAISAWKGGFSLEVLNYLFGSVLSVHDEDLLIAFIFSIIFLGYLIFFYTDLISTTFDDELAYAEGINVERINTILGIFTALTIVQAIKIIGVLLVTSLLIMPAVTALQFSKGFKRTLFLSMIFGVISVVVGIGLSIVVDLPSGSSIVLVSFGILLLSVFFARKKRLTTGKN
ncbi:MAG: metal ABC transporter permease [Desulfobacterota bacterium]|nr:metal ABC transporter permease [Thermodesulfobacteriota bacterium]MDW8001683.1 metal ABC transporter permease [Deltaproteobacteria bacterium]